MPPENKTEKGRVLVIDDDQNVLHVVSEILKRDGYTVRSASDGLDGLKINGSEHFDLIITDLLMPECDGLETIMALRKRASPPRILAISGCAQTLGSQFMGVAQKLGADATLPKPFSRAELLAKVGTLLSKPQG